MIESLCYNTGYFQGVVDSYSSRRLLVIYFKTAQYVPGKGNAWTYYECDENSKILRQLTTIPETGDTDRVADPIVKKLYRPEKLQPADASEFLALWDGE